MSRPQGWIVLALGALCGCTNPSSDPATTSAVSSDGAIVVPTEAEADAAAAQTIDESNADAEFEKLMKEIENGD